MVFAGIGLAVLQPALLGGFVSDDHGYIWTNPYVTSIDGPRLLAILDPAGEPAFYSTNYAPVVVLAHAAEWRLFGPSTLGYHVTNVLLHALCAVLLAAFLRDRGIVPLAAAGAALLFLVHPAHVEAVAWISQLKTLGSFALAAGALLAHPRRPGLALVLYALALLTKAQALAVLPVAWVLWWCARGSPEDPWRDNVGWLVGWLAVSALWAIPEFGVFSTYESHVVLSDDPWVRWRTIVAFGARYLAMAVTSWGVSAFHDPPRAETWLDPWWLAGLVAGVVLAVRALLCLHRGRPEAALWAWAAAAYVPISQVFAFTYPIADRYLYFVMPGLLGGALLWSRDRWPRVSEVAGGAERAARIAAALSLAVAVGFAAHSHARATVWRSDVTLAVDSALHYPDGIAGRQLRANRAGRRGDGPAAAAELRGAFERGWDRFMDVDSNPALASVRDDPALRQLVRDMAAAWIERASHGEKPGQAELRVLAQAHLALGETDEAIALLERALAEGGPFSQTIRAELAALQGGAEAP